jgi:hypothetical protein
LSHMNPIIRQAAQWAKEENQKVVFDADYYHEQIEKNYDVIDVFIASEFYYRAVFSNGTFNGQYRKNCVIL